MAKRAPQADIEWMLTQVEDFFPSMFHDERLLLTGGTGFFGKWITQFLLAAQDRWNLENQILMLSRDPARARMEMPWLEKRSEIEWISSDIRDLRAFKEKTADANITTILHGAAAASRDLNENKPMEMFDTIVEGARHVFELARSSQARVLFLSSGAVYGPQPSSIGLVNEDNMGAPDPLDPRAAYGEAKRVAEMMGALASRAYGFEFKIARCFAFVGPYLPLDSHFAVGNFLNNALKKNSIQIGGDGTPLRSYMHAAELVVWLVRILIQGRNCSAYNVGSDQAVSIQELAHQVLQSAVRERVFVDCPEVKIAKSPDPSKPHERYVPSIEKIKVDLGLKLEIGLQDALSRTLRWHLSGP